MENRIYLKQSEMPTQWYNVIPDLPGPPAPVLHPATLQPVSPGDLTPLFPMGLIEQEVSGERWIKIPDEVMKIYSIWRPTPLVRATRLEKLLDTPAHIYYKNESVSPAGSHKPNTAVAQAYYNKKEGTKRIVTETGAGQWGSAMAMACNFFNIELQVYMVKVSYNQKPYRRSLMHVWGAKVFASPSDQTNYGRELLKKDPDNPGSLGIAISEAVEKAATDPDAHYSLGSVLNHVCMHQTILGLEAKKQMEIAGEYPDVVIGCVGGGSNFSGLSFPFVPDKAAGKKVRLLGVEPASCPTLTKGPYTFDYGDTARMAPVVKMHTLGHDFVPPGIHAGGLRYHGDAPLLCQLVHAGVIEARAYPQLTCFEAALMFARSEGTIPAPETSHAIRAAIDEALEAKKRKEKRVILFNFSGHGHFDMSAYDDYLSGKLTDCAYPEAKIKAALANLPKVKP
ncbi:MAG: TrpB-like pyridoxal phosphate-dependent enzyme [Nitrospirae bacterium CG_4_9_14_3_um_filter_53_35]|nr:MAG: TrpB-like pyridoxal-phosphate dependent enzyme [Nitrospirae bacterium CG2_30_53_67]PIS37289.1 MAG: TrpB-like pyridoxal phosphate-dependent enzyme [Nitrospirae bacterium CG08_land_8_20_14_0_20_52_24]PIV84895.1 MAG: TrpB-like pyridoxal phosphate-dependent enzyme [Nitrospirae bacterium CG17_big_fil_post_rev_8_21_14_2_50_50_9]PIW84724.1 MAG: TrpB-like pyridoxal phosphate-dependent enzyme [Nitrospirae bacterium CG_4_8_14_3_um_filter_50_41]PIX84987.1 MAG: TrpB-like pyridoxal phosphate-depende